MVRYSDLIRKGIKKDKEGLAKETEDLKKQEKPKSSLRFSTLKEFRTSPELNIEPEQKDSKDKEVEKINSVIVDYLYNTQRLVKNDEQFSINQAVDFGTQIISTPDLIEKLYQSTAMYQSHNNEDYLIHHLIKVMIYALKIGTGLRYSRKELLELLLAALFYDIGLFRIPKNIMEKTGKLTQAELDIIKNHTKIGRDILSRFESEHPMMPRTAYEHHERKNGSGYPEGLNEKEICEYAKIIAVADSFDAMINSRPHRKALAQYFSIKQLVESKKSLFSAKIIKVFLDEIGIFPIGSYVQLNNKEIGKVVGTNKLHPLKPTVKLMFDSHGNKISKETIIVLDGHPVLHVTGSISEDAFPSES